MVLKGGCSGMERLNAGMRLQWIQWMRRLMTRADLTGQDGEIPVAAVILDVDGRCIGHGRNRRETHRDPLGHAELRHFAGPQQCRGTGANNCTLLVH